MAQTDISVIILIGQEKIHLQRCIERLANGSMLGREGSMKHGYDLVLGI